MISQIWLLLVKTKSYRKIFRDESDFAISTSLAHDKNASFHSKRLVATTKSSAAAKSRVLQHLKKNKQIKIKSLKNGLRISLCFQNQTFFFVTKEWANNKWTRGMGKPSKSISMAESVEIFIPERGFHFSTLSNGCIKRSSTKGC